ncbi:WD40-repeat-containing domain protein [Radiomyces spectabilis]|uniref:WD40-repeat-containing domain protein n=1 Tax=Radiomyces spectabilis TaxID=64574 RepID=UPI0022200F37|nr:WD40-repeat-containing domain protein [Radiomyces spectabilis]KAI8388013.1 WD40-repeat-containing domain protein [Radiomyces spectabilis]
MVTTEERSKNLEVENAQLLQRWLDKMNEEADKMNEATKFYESFLEQARSVGQIIRKSGGQWVMHPANKGGEQDKPLSTIVLPSQVFKRISAHDGEIHCIQAASTGKYFATGGSDKKVKVFSPNSGQLLQTLTGALQTITSISFSPNDDLILGSSTDNATRIWSLGNGRIKHTLTGHIGKVYAAKFCSGANRVVSGSHDRTLKVWDLQKAYCIRTIFTFSSCNDLCLMDSDGQTIVSGHFDNNIRLWDARTGNGIKQLTGLHTGQITSVSMSPEQRAIIAVLIGRELATDGIVHIWNAQSGLLEKAVAGHKSSICGVAWNPTGNFLYSADKNRTICLWETAVGQS